MRSPVPNCSRQAVISLRKMLPHHSIDCLPTSCQIRHSARVLKTLEILNGFGGKEGYGCVGQVDGLHDDAEVFREVFKFVYEDLSLLVRGVEQLPGK